MRGIIRGDSIPQLFVPQLIELYRGRGGLPIRSSRRRAVTGACRSADGCGAGPSARHQLRHLKLHPQVVCTGLRAHRGAGQPVTRTGLIAMSKAAVKRIRVGIIGANPDRRWAAQAHIPALTSLSDDFEITALSTSRRESADAASEGFGVPTAFDNHQDLVNSAAVDVVAVTVKAGWSTSLVRTLLPSSASAPDSAFHFGRAGAGAWRVDSPCPRLATAAVQWLMRSRRDRRSVVGPDLSQ